MKSLLYAVALTSAMMTSSALGAVAFTAGPQEVSIVEGTPIYMFGLQIAAQDGEIALDGIRFAVSIDMQTGSGAAVLVGEPVLSEQFATGFTNTPSALPPEFANTVRAGNISQDIGGPDASLAGGFVGLQFMVDTSGLVAGDTFTIDPNFNSFGQAVFEGTSFPVTSTPTLVSVTAIPEPSGFAIVAILGGAGMVYRRRKQRQKA